MIAFRKKIIAADLFCGAGGTSTGLLHACRELGFDVELIAINHWPVSIATHTANHADATHFCEDLAAIDPRKAVPGGRLDLLVASPECTHHSNARGGRPMQDQSRASAWHVCRWAQSLQVDNILIENVPEFRHWGGLGANGRPLKEQRGKTYRAWLQVLRSLNYRVDDAILNAADFGDATTRKRLFIIARRGRRRIPWPTPSHSPRAETDLFGARQRWRPAREIIDWNIPGKSIFARKRPLSPNTMRRIVAGLRRFGGPELEPFIVMLNGTTEKQTEASSRSVDDPLSTITAGGVNHYLAEPFLIGQQSGATARSVEDPAPTVATKGAIGVVQPFLVPQFGEREGQAPRTHDVNVPLPAPTSHGAGALVEPFVVMLNGTGDEAERRNRSINDPLPTVRSGGKTLGLAQPFVVSAGGPNCEARSAEDPLGTVLTRDHRALVQPFLVKTDQTGSEGPGVRSVEDPAPTLTVNGAIGVCEPFIVPQFASGEPHDVGEPLGTLTTTSRGVGLAQSFLVPVTHAGGEERCYDPANPLPTITGAHRGETALVQPFVVQTDQTGGGSGCVRSVDDPLITVVSKQNAAVCVPHISKFYGTGTAKSIEEPLDTVTARDRFALVQPTIRTADGQTLALDIHFRMLQPHELAAAMSFPAGYHFTGNREAQVKQIGNAVPVNLAKALIRALLDDDNQKNP